MIDDLQRCYNDSNSLLQFTASANEAEFDLAHQVSFLQRQVWNDVPTHRIEKVIEQEQSRIAELEVFDITESTVAPRYADITDLDLLSGYEFEAVLAEILSRVEGDAEVTQQSGDQGIDVVWYTDSETIGIQAKAYSKGNRVSNSAIQEAHTGAKFYQDSHSIDKAAVMTTSTYTTSARDAADKTGVRLYDRPDLKKWLTVSKLETKTIGTLIDT